jgi:hypothetical protein
MDIKLVVAVMAFSGVITSALVQYALGRKSEKSKKVIEVRSQAYLDLVNSVSEIASSSKINNGVFEPELLTKLIQSKTRVVLVGSDDVVEEVRNYFTKFGKLDSDDAFDSFSSIVAAMRLDITGSNKTSKKTLSEAIFGKHGQV